MRASLVSLSQNSSGSNASRVGSKPRKASSKPGHLDSITFQAKPAENTRLLISASTRSSWTLRSASGSGLGGKRRASASAPPLRFSARARMVLNGVTLCAFVVPIAASGVSFRLGAAVFVRNRRRASVHHLKFVLAPRARIPSLPPS